MDTLDIDVVVSICAISTHLEDVAFAVNLARVDLIEECHQYERVEHHGKVSCSLLL